MSVLAFAPAAAPDDKSREVADMKTKLTAYWDAVNMITLHAHSISTQVLIAVDEKNPPEWWTKLSTNFANCQTHARRWITHIYPSLTRVPQAIIDYDNTFKVVTKKILNLLRDIGDKTPTPRQKGMLIGYLRLLSEEMARCRKKVEAVRTDITTFTNDIFDDHKALTTGAASITKAIEDNDNAIKAINADIAALRLEIERLNAQIIAALHGLAASIAVSYMLFSVSAGLSIFIAVVGIGISLGFIIDGLVRINKKRDEIEAKTAGLEKHKALAVTLNSIAAVVDAMVVSTKTITEKMSVVSFAWQTLQEKLDSVANNIERARVEDMLIIWKQEVDIEAAREGWAELHEYAKTLQEQKLQDSKQAVSFRSIA